MSAKLLACVLAALAMMTTESAADTLANIKGRGNLVCGVSASTAFSATKIGNNWAGLGADYCRGLASAIFNDPTKVQFAELAPADRAAALSTGKVDVLADLLPWTLDADAGQGFRFVAAMFYDGQSFMVSKASGMKSARDLSSKPVCVEAGSDAEAAAADYFDANNITAKTMPMAGRDAMIATYLAGSCAAISAPSSALAGIRAGLPAPADHVLLPDMITKEPLSLVVGQGDDRWFSVARWGFYALLDAEELGVTQSNVDEMLGSDNISIRRFLGVEDDFGAAIGLNKDWAYQIVKGVGNYADIFDRNVGEDTPLKLPRGLNALWNKGGIQYSPPVR